MYVDHNDNSRKEGIFYQFPCLHSYSEAVGLVSVDCSASISSTTA